MTGPEPAGRAASARARAPAPLAAAALPPPPAAAGPARAPWLAEGVVVKIVSKALRGAGYYGAKAAVVRLLDGGFVGELEVLGSGDVLRVDQAELETVVPKPGGRVAVLAGRARGARGVLASIDEKRFQGEVRLDGREGQGGEALWLEYEEFTKLAG